MSEDNNRMHTIPMDISSKDALIRKNHPVIREIRQIPQILFDSAVLQGNENCISLKNLFQKNNMDHYHVDCLILRKIARNLLLIQKHLADRRIYPGLYDLEDIYVNMDDSSYEVYITHPEKFQLLTLEQDYDWYPEDERLFGDLLLFDADSQLRADNRLLYKVLVASAKGNVKVPPKASSQDYSSIFYGTLPLVWKSMFEGNEICDHLTWDSMLDDAISSEEAYEKLVKLSELEGMDIEAEEAMPANVEEEFRHGEIHCMWVLLRTQESHSLEISRMLYEQQDQLAMEEEHGKLHVEQGFLYGDGMIHQKKFQQYPKNYRTQIPGKIREYPMVETLLLGCEWMQDYLGEKKEDSLDRQYRMYLLCDGKVENNAMFRICLQRLQRLADQKVQIHLLRTKESRCEALDRLASLLERIEDVS